MELIIQEPLDPSDVDSSVKRSLSYPIEISVIPIASPSMVEGPSPLLLMAVRIVTIGTGIETRVVQAIHIVWRAETPLEATTCIEVRSMHDSDLVHPVSFELS
jgi:hypothetical protein